MSSASDSHYRQRSKSYSHSDHLVDYLYQAQASSVLRIEIERPSSRSSQRLFPDPLGGADLRGYFTKQQRPSSDEREDRGSPGKKDKGKRKEDKHSHRKDDKRRSNINSNDNGYASESTSTQKLLRRSPRNYRRMDQEKQGTKGQSNDKDESKMDVDATGDKQKGASSANPASNDGNPPAVPSKAGQQPESFVDLGAGSPPSSSTSGSTDLHTKSHGRTTPSRQGSLNTTYMDAGRTTEDSGPGLFQAIGNFLGSGQGHSHNAKGKIADGDWQARYVQAIREIQSQQTVNRKLQDDLAKERSTADKWGKEYEALRVDFGTAIARLRSTEEDLTNAKIQFNNLAQEYNNLNNKFRNTESQHEKDKKLLDSRTAELRTAETFLTKYDDLPGEEVIAMISALNTNILDVSCGFQDKVEKYLFEVPPHDRITTGAESEVKELEGIVGKVVIEAIRRSDKDSEPTIVQIALQALLIHSVANFLEVWPIAPSAKDSLWSIYQSVHRRELQSIGARWRALGSLNYRLEFAKEYEDFKRNAVEQIELKITRVLCLAGIGKEFEKVLGIVQKFFSKELVEIVNIACSFAQKVKEQVDTTDYSVFLVKPGSVYDDSKMAGHGQQSAKNAKLLKGAKIVCTTDLGVERSTNTTQPGDRVRTMKNAVLSKAAVIFEQELRDMLKDSAAADKPRGK